jgi:adenine deaminase
MIKTNVLKAAGGRKKAELVLKNCQIINVFTTEIEQGDIAIENGQIVGIGKYKGMNIIDMKGAYVAPGFIDGHVHIESSMMVPHEFAKLVLPCGTTSVIADPHEIANVLGVKGIDYMMNSASKVPLDVYMMIPSCVPATKFETSGSVINVKDITKMLKRNNVLGLGEVMSYPEVIMGDHDMLNKIKAMKDRPIDGHAPGLTSKLLNAYISAGIQTDHESSTLDELIEKTRRGLYVHLREGSQTRNVTDLLPGISDKNRSRILFCTDDKHPEDIANEGHINYNINLAINYGISPIWAIQMATINTAIAYKLPQVGAIAPGYKADLVVFDSLDCIQPKQVYKDGQLIVDKGNILFTTPILNQADVCNTVKFDVEAINLNLKLKSNLVKVIGLVNNNVTTTKEIIQVKLDNGIYQNTPNSKILKLAVIERHHHTNKTGLGLVKGYGLQNGAVAMTIAHDSHNLICIGDSDYDMMLAIRKIHEIQGGIVLVQGGKIMDSLTLEVAGIMTEQPSEYVRSKLRNMEKIVRSMGVGGEIVDPFLQLAFLSLPVIPELKLTDMGLFDTAEYRIVPLEVGD